MTTIDIRNAGLALAAALATSAATLAAFPLSAHAAPAVAVTAEVPAVRVSHTDLNLASPAGLKKLDARIRSAAERLCIVPGGKSLEEAQEAKACVDETVAGTQPQVRRAILLQTAPQLATASR